jgi:hypothetical protein
LQAAKVQDDVLVALLEKPGNGIAQYFYFKRSQSSGNVHERNCTGVAEKFTLVTVCTLSAGEVILSGEAGSVRKNSAWKRSLEKLSGPCDRMGRPRKAIGA